MPNLIPLKTKNKPLITADGSISLYSMDYNEGYRAKSVGAFTESLHKFYSASGIEELLQKQDVRLLDICLGGGSNLSVTLDRVLSMKHRHKLHIVTVERQSSLFDTIRQNKFMWPYRGYEMLRKLIDEGQAEDIRLDIAIGDARNILRDMRMEFDVVYFDPFGKRKNPEMWTVDVFRDVHRLCSDIGRAATYSSGREIREDFVRAGFRYTVTPKPDGAFQEGTVFYKI
ncbi:tRNA (5-methylaminomethyl-2-thiouridine)(34)-methyltransferase MnmD [Seleniivibrio woodruffii]|uniref:tRNA (5-methylaminomethyl-2-thiouridine)(34)-methyltransferase MnmD n=1 Tax=Seleniivibrio woodruffii TaxID=1078050 RepID=UPI00240A3A32|nr:MnmC family methyltransferase [Seleniivibrio woodruffii]